MISARASRPARAFYFILTYLLDVVLETTMRHDKYKIVVDLSKRLQQVAFNSKVWESERIASTITRTLSENVASHFPIIYLLFEVVCSNYSETNFSKSVLGSGLSPGAHVISTIPKQVISRNRFHKNFYEMCKIETHSCKAR